MNSVSGPAIIPQYRFAPTSNPSLSSSETMHAAGVSQSTLVQPKVSPQPHRVLTSPSFSLSYGRRGPSLFRTECPKALKIAAAVSGLKSAPSSTDVSERKTTSPIAVIDNYDSFTYNLCQYMGELGCNYEVYRNDELTLDELKRKNPRGILISPGPGTPQDSGISLQTVLELGPTVPLFGVCMGLQCIGEAFGGKIVRAPNGVMHGKSSPVYYNEGDEEGLFTGLSNPFTAGRYHSLVIEKDTFPHDALEITAWTEDGLVMAARHKTYRHLLGVQFHPESIITSEGKVIVKNFIKLIEKKEAESKH